MSNPEIRALGEMVVIRPDKLQESWGSLYLPNDSQDPPERGEVVSVGRGWHDRKGVFHPTELKVGQRILFPRYRGYPLELATEVLLIMPESDVLCEVIEAPEDTPMPEGFSYDAYVNHEFSEAEQTHET